MVLSKFDSTNFTFSINKTLKNTLNFENCSEYLKYINDTGGAGTSTILGLYDIDIVPLKKEILEYLKTNSNIRYYSDDDEKKYRYRPMTLSIDEYGYIDMWWLILALNNFQSPYEFKGFKSLYIPPILTIKALMDKLLYKNKDVGVSNAS